MSKNYNFQIVKIAHLFCLKDFCCDIFRLIHPNEWAGSWRMDLFLETPSLDILLKAKGFHSAHELRMCSFVLAQPPTASIHFNLLFISAYRATFLTFPPPPKNDLGGASYTSSIKCEP